MILELLTEHHLEFVSLKEAAEAHLSQHMSKCHIAGNLMHWHNYCIVYCRLVMFLFVCWTCRMVLLFVLYLYFCVIAYLSFPLNLHSGAKYCICG